MNDERKVVHLAKVGRSGALLKDKVEYGDRVFWVLAHRAACARLGLRLKWRRGAADGVRLGATVEAEHARVLERGELEDSDSLEAGWVAGHDFADLKVI